MEVLSKAVWSHLNVVFAGHQKTIDGVKYISWWYLNDLSSTIEDKDLFEFMFRRDWSAEYTGQKKILHLCNEDAMPDVLTCSILVNLTQFYDLIGFDLYNWRAASHKKLKLCCRGENIWNKHFLMTLSDAWQQELKESVKILSIQGWKERIGQ